MHNHREQRGAAQHMCVLSVWSLYKFFGFGTTAVIAAAATAEKKNTRKSLCEFIQEIFPHHIRSVFTRIYWNNITDSNVWKIRTLFFYPWFDGWFGWCLFVCAYCPFPAIYYNSGYVSAAECSNRYSYVCCRLTTHTKRQKKKNPYACVESKPIDQMKAPETFESNKL